MRRVFLSFFGTGLSPFAPGTMGSLAAMIPAFAVLFYLSQATLFLLSILIFLIAIPQINAYEEASKTHDDKSIVIDEVAGIFLACSISGREIPYFILSFVFFRLLDIFKPSLIGVIDRKCKGGLGVMGDDMLAGLFAGLLSAICHGVIARFL